MPRAPPRIAGRPRTGHSTAGRDGTVAGGTEQAARAVGSFRPRECSVCGPGGAIACGRGPCLHCGGRDDRLPLDLTPRTPAGSPVRVAAGEMARGALDQVRSAIRVKHYGLRTEKSYVNWIRRFILFHGKRHPRELGGPEISTFLNHLAVAEGVASSTQNQALNALVFLYPWVGCSNSSFPLTRSRTSSRGCAAAGTHSIALAGRATRRHPGRTRRPRASAPGPRASPCGVRRRASAARSQ